MPDAPLSGLVGLPDLRPAAIAAPTQVKDEIIEQDSATEEHVVPDKPRPRKAPQRPPANPTFLDELRFDAQNGGPPLKEFLESGSYSSNNQRYLAIAYWLKNCLALNEISHDHIFTAYRHMNWAFPTDTTQPFRHGKVKKSWFKDGSEQGMYTITFIGEDIIKTGK